jgi:hypothetical protein
MRGVVILFIHLIVIVVRLARPGGLHSVVAESLLVKHQLRILNRGRKRAPNLRAAERFIAGLCTLFMNPARVLRSAIVLKPSTLLPTTCRWRIADLGQNHNAQGYCTLAPRIGQPLMLSAWPDLSVRNATKKSCSSSAFSTSSSTQRQEKNRSSPVCQVCQLRAS